MHARTSLTHTPSRGHHSLRGSFRPPGTSTPHTPAAAVCACACAHPYTSSRVAVTHGRHTHSHAATRPFPIPEEPFAHVLPSHSPLPPCCPCSEHLLWPRPGAGDRYNMAPQGICLLGEGRPGLIKQVGAKQGSECWKRSKDRERTVETNSALGGPKRLPTYSGHLAHAHTTPC